MQTFHRAVILSFLVGLAPCTAWATTYDWTLSGEISGSGQLTIGAPYSVGYTVANAPGATPGSVSTTGADILSFTGEIDGHAVTLLGGKPGFLPNGRDQGTPPGVSGSPAFTPYNLSYDNILYPTQASLLIPCELTPALTNQYLDAYGVALNYNNVEGEIWGNGPFGAPGTYTFATLDHVAPPNSGYTSSYTSETFAISAPEPSTWAMMLVGFAALGLGGIRATHKAATVKV